jgi:hypothetical protein
MDSAARILFASAWLWALAALAFQAVGALRKFRTPNAERVGDVRRALLYNFTIAMLPSHKESVALHPISFGAGALLHLAVFASLTGAFSTLFFPASFQMAGSFFGGTAVAGLLSCLFLLFRRFFEYELRTISVPDDFVASLSVAFFLGMAALASFGSLSIIAFQFATTLLLVYLPLGKLRHAVFFFLARADLGRKLGWRGVYPPSREAANG